MKHLIIAVAASAISLGAFAASHAEKGAMAKPAASAPAAKTTAAPAAKTTAAPAAAPASAPAKKAKKSASAPA